MKSIPKKLGSEYYRSYLSAQGKEFYDCILNQLLQMDYSGIAAFTIREISTAAEDCFAAYNAIRDDHPEFFFLGFQSEFTCVGKSGKLTYPILYSTEIIQRVQYQLRKCICSLVRGTASLTPMEREVLVYERIAKKLTYNDHCDVRDHNIVGPILSESGVCEGHNALLLLCLRRIGIPCIKVYGKTDSDGWHCWTIAWLNGSPVHCDVTWDNSNDGIVWFNYLNLSDNQISVNHYAFRSNQIPVCQSEDLTYYHYRDLCVDSQTDLRNRLNLIERSTSPVLLHLSYMPKGGDLLNEIDAAIKSANIYGEISIQTCPDLRNIIITRT